MSGTLKPSKSHCLSSELTQNRSMGCCFAFAVQQYEAQIKIELQCATIDRGSEYEDPI